MTALLERPVAALPAARPPVAPIRTRAPRPRRAGRRLDLALLLPLGVLVGVTHAVGLAAGPSYGDDEGTYTAQAWALVHEGTLAHYTYWYDHPPLGWMLIALWNVTFGHLFHPATSVIGGREMMVAVAIGCGLLIYVLGRRLGLRRWAAALAVVAWALSPLALSYARMVYLDNIAVLFLLGALVLALSPRRHLWAFAGAGLCLAAAVLTKETFLLSAPAVAYAVHARSAGKTRPFCVAAFAATTLLVLALYPLFAVLRGELLPGADHVSLVDALRFQLVTRPSTGSPLNSSSGSAALVGRWLHTDPYLLVAGVVLSPLAVAVRRLRPVGLAVLVPVVVSLRPGYLPDAFVVALLPFGALVVAGLADLAARRVAARATTATLGTDPGTSHALVLPAAVRTRDGSWQALGRHHRLVPAGVTAALAGAVVLMLALVAGPSWASGDRGLGRQSATSTEVAAEQWVGAHVPHSARVLVDDTMWVDLVQRGFNPHLGVIWFYKTDFTNNLDPSVARSLPDGYRDIDYVVETPVMRTALAQLPQGLQELRAAIRYGRPLTTIGSGADRIDVLQVVVPAGAPRLPSPVRP